ncbi:MAG: LPP20 family lipoprotein [Candidatus Cloacimonadota bacterium]|nr:LPP20 family lipoprotein [Candidatus Cloacimonadota bacterium]
MKKTIFYSLLVILVISCSVQAKTADKGKPEWLQNPKSVYPENRYLTAIGEGDTRSAAEDMAAGNLSKIFESEVSADQTVSERYYELISSEESEYEQQTDITKNITVRSRQKLFNIQFAESYTDNMGRVHVLAYIDRLRTAGIYEEKIDNNSMKVNSFLSQAEKSSDILKKYACYSAARVISKQNETLLQQLTIISPSSREIIQLPYNSHDILKSYQHAAENIKFVVEITNDPDNKVTILVKEILTDMGFVVGKPPVLIANGSLVINSTDLNRQDLKFVRYELQLELSDNKNNSLITISDKGREGHVSENEAKARAIMTIENKIKVDLKKKLNEYFDRMVS